MKNKIFITLIFLGLICSTSAQNFTFDYNISYDEKKESSTSAKENFVFEGKKIFVYSTQELGKRKVKLYASAYSKKNNTATAFAFEDPETEKIGNLKNLDSKYNQIRMSFNASFNYNGVTSVFTSAAKNYLGLSYLMDATNGKGNSFFIDVFDEEMNLKTTHEIPLKNFDSKLVFDNIELDNKGNVYMSGRKDAHKKSSEYVFLMVSGNDFKQINTDLGNGKEISNAKIYFSENSDNLILTGMYKDETQKAIGGSFFLSINQGKIVNIQTYPLDSKLLNNEEIKWDEYKLRPYIELNNDEFIMAVERVQEVVNVSGDTRFTHYVSGDILLFSFDLQGDLNFTKSIKKAYRSMANYWSYDVLVKSSGIYFLFNSVNDLEERSKLTKLTKKFKTSFDVVKMNFDGNIEYRETFADVSVTDNFIFRPDYAENLEGGKIYIEFFNPDWAATRKHSLLTVK